jgi:hypothetical protein
MAAANAWALLIASLILVPVAIGTCIRMPRLVVYGFITLFFMFASSTWGQVDTEATLYARGTGMFYFSLVNLLLFIAAAAALLRKLANPYVPYFVFPWPHYFGAFAFMLLAHLLLGMMNGIDISLILGYNGIINVLNMLLFMYIVVMALHDEKDKRDLMLLILFLGAIRGLYGLVRYVFFGGDSANPYRNFEGIDISIFFFDIGDSFVCALAGFAAAWLLTSPQVKMSLVKRVMLYAFLGLMVAAIALSFRRSSLLGLVLMFSLLLYRLPAKQKIIFGSLAFAMLSATIAVMINERLQDAGATGGILSSLFYDVTGDRAGTQGRFYELYAAAKSMGDNWLFGLGSWGAFSGDRSILDYHTGRMDFVHSGFGHIVLKTGVAGLLLFCALLWSYISYYFRHRKRLQGNSALLADTGFAGMLFWIPTLLVGTPIIEFRTMMLVGLTLAMPFVAVGLHRRMHTHYAIA